MGIVAGALLVRAYGRAVVLRRVREHLALFSYDQKSGVFDVARPLESRQSERVRLGVLMLHGYSASVQEYVHLAAEFDRLGIAYRAPRLPGFGVNTLRELEQVKMQDWLDATVTAYDQLAQVAQHIVVIGHSNGGNLALLLSHQRPVHALILLGPNVEVSVQDAPWKRRLESPVLGPLLRWFKPYFLKPVRPGRIANTDTLEPVAATWAFHYPGLPLGSLSQLWGLQDRVQQLGKLDMPILVICGKHDASIDLPATLNWLHARGANPQVEILQNSAHNVLEDYDKDRAHESVLNFVTSRQGYLASTTRIIAGARVRS